MINPYKIKKIGTLILCPMISTICFYIGMMFYGFVGAMGFLAGGILISYLIGTLMLKNPFTDMLEGKGILALNFDSTGVITPFIVSVFSPYIQGIINKQKMTDVFDRSAVLQIEAPIINKTPVKPNPTGGIKIILDEKTYNEARFSMISYPVIIWNNQLKTVMTKDFFAEKEKDSFAEHGILYLNRKMEELTSAIRDFGRYVVELTKPQTNFFSSTFGKVIIIGGIILLLLLFAPKVIQIFSGTMSSGSNAFGIAKGATVTPR